MKKNFRVRVYVNNSAPIVISGGNDAFGVFIETIEASGEGYYAVPARRITINASDLTPLPAGSDADFELNHPISADAFHR